MPRTLTPPRSPPMRRAPPRSAGVRLLALRRPPWTEGRRRQLDRGRKRRAKRCGARARAEARVPRARPQRASAFRRRAAAFLSDPQRRSGRTAACRSRMRPTSRRAGRSARATTAPCSRATTSRSIVAKNSGGEATYGKIEAARALRLPVIMLKRPRAARGRLRRDGRRGLAVARSCADAFDRARRVDERARARPRDHAASRASRR